MPSQSLTLLIMAGLAVISAAADAQELGDPGVIELDNDLLQISVNQHVVEVTLLGGSQDNTNEIDLKIAQLTRHVGKFLAATEAQEDRLLSDTESLYRSTSYARKLIERMELLDERVAFLDENHVLTKKISAAADAFDVALVKKLLKEKLALEDETVAEAAFQLGGFQELDGEYQDAWANYQKASNLQPENQLYMDAHGKNEF